MRGTRAALGAGAVAVILASGCGRVDGTASPEDGATTSPAAVTAEAYDARARAVLAAWRTAAAAEAWRAGFVPLEDLTIPPPNGFPDSDLKQAFAEGVYRTRVSLPDGPPADGVVRFAAGGMLRVPVPSARDTYAALDRGDPPCSIAPEASRPPDVPREPSTAATRPPDGGMEPDAPVGTAVPQNCAALTVTAADRATVTLRTSRGPATVPAWRFSVAEVSEPIVRVAVDPAAVAVPPTPPTVSAPPPPGLVGALSLTGVDGGTLRFELGVGACDEDIRPLVMETADAVVLGGSVRTKPGACIAILKLQPVAVTLDGPLGDRVVLDAASGQPLVERVR